MMTSLVLVLSLALFGSADGFMLNIFQKAANPALKDFAKAQAGTLFNFNLDVGRKDDAHLSVNGLLLELLQEPVNDKNPPLPGINGPNPTLSSGAKSLKVQEQPYFIDIYGKQNVELLDGCWEMIWRDGASAGSLICGFDLDKEAKRNDAVLPSGRVYLSFPIWTKEGLAEAQKYKSETQERARKYLQDKDEEMAKYQSTDNILMKALHYRNAAAAVEKYSLTGVSNLDVIPSDNDVMPIEDNLLLTTKGTVWTKSKAFLRPDHVLLGSVTASPGVVRVSSELKP